ncbi:MAG: DEAD/DEAH box helicase [Ktedonobacteraceae bacterium]|nr:DEAD/DEAH box helicase [Ktedonobacteraceae bacterium]
MSKRENWPADALKAPGAWRSAIEIEQLLESGLAEEHEGAIRVPYANFEAIQSEMPVSLIGAWSQHSPFLLKIDRKSDLGRPDFQYRYTYLLAGKPVHVDRLGYYVQRGSGPEVFLLDFQMYSLVDAMDSFNALGPPEKTPHESWLTFAKVKGCAAEVGAALDSTLNRNDVIIPSTLGLDMREDEDGALTFLPKCAELADEDFHQVFERNAGAERLYSLDRPGLGRVRIVLNDDQHQVLQRMKRVRRVKGDLKERLKRDPVQAFDGIADHIDLPYGDRVIGVGEFPFAPTPRPTNTESTMARLWEKEAAQPANTIGDSERSLHAPGSEQQTGEPQNGHVDGSAEVPGADGVPCEEGTGASEPLRADDARLAGVVGKKYLLIETNEESVRNELVSGAKMASQFAQGLSFERPRALREDRSLRPHQEHGVRWLQTCSQIQGRTGVLLADDMGVGKTVQILTFLAWCIESGKFPGLSRSEPPFQPILIIAPLILVDTRTWEKEMEKFFANEGVIFWPVLSLHGEQLAKLRRDDTAGRETEVGRPILDLNRIQRHKVVITNYETIKGYQHSFAYLKDGVPLWSFIISDEAQEFKVPNTKISHAMKALKTQMHIACTGTPVENRLLDLWNICDALQPGLLSSAREFVAKFENSKAGPSQENSLLELKKTLLFQRPHAYLLRRTKSDVAELPAKSLVKLNCEMSDTEIEAHRSLLSRLRSDSRQSRFLAALHSFVQLYQHPSMLTDNAEDLSAGELVSQSSKLRVVIAKLHEIRGRREKVIIFARLRTMQAILAKVLQAEFQLPVRIINGETKLRGSLSLNKAGLKARNAILHDFQTMLGFNILILSPFVAGIGLTIVEANHVIHYGRWWNPAVESQATDRAYRIGQTKEVSVYLPILRDPSRRVAPSFDERLDLLMDNKQRLAEDFLRPLAPEDELRDELFQDLSAEAARQT